MHASVRTFLSKDVRVEDLAVVGAEVFRWISSDDAGVVHQDVEVAVDHLDLLHAVAIEESDVSSSSRPCSVSAEPFVDSRDSIAALRQLFTKAVFFSRVGLVALEYPSKCAIIRLGNSGVSIIQLRRLEGIEDILFGLYCFLLQGQPG